VVVALLVSGLIVTLLAVTVLVTLGPLQAQQSVAPLLDIGRVVYIEGFLERLDLFLLATWVLVLRSRSRCCCCRPRFS
jgi:hypothetical protein